MTFEERFEKAFENGLADMKFFARDDQSGTLAELKADALAFQEAIDEGRVTEVAEVD